MDLWGLHYPVVAPRRTDFYCILNMITQVPKEDASFLYPYSSYMLSGILIGWMHSRTYYAVRNDILQLRTPHLLLKTVVLQDIIKQTIMPPLSLT